MTHPGSTPIEELPGSIPIEPPPPPPPADQPSAQEPLWGGGQTTTAVRIYCQMMDNLVDPKSPRHARLHTDAIELLQRIDPQDAIEQLMSEQILWLHARMAHLNYYASLQTRREPMHVLHSAADRLANTLRRHLMAFADYRNPGRKRFTAVRQANIAHQQIVTNAAPSLTESPFHDPPISRPVPAAQTPKISPVARGPAVAAKKRRALQALAKEHRPAHDPGEETVQPEPPDPRAVHE